MSPLRTSQVLSKPRMLELVDTTGLPKGTVQVRVFQEGQRRQLKFSPDREPAAGQDPGPQAVKKKVHATAMSTALIRKRNTAFTGAMVHQPYRPSIEPSGARDNRSCLFGHCAPAGNRRSTSPATAGRLTGVRLEPPARHRRPDPVDQLGSGQRLRRRHRGQNAGHRGYDRGRSSEGMETLIEPGVQTAEVACSSVSDIEFSPPVEASAEQQMWAFYLEEQAAGRTPTGADLDRVAGTNNYGRRVLRRWRVTGQGPGGAMAPPGTAGLGRPHRFSSADEDSTDVVVSISSGS